MKKLVVLAVLALAGCAHVRPVVHYTCVGCQALVSSGACRFFQAAPGAPPIPVPECKPGEVVVVKNWKQMTEQGATPALGCEKENK
jgi:hypothetical protein